MDGSKLTDQSTITKTAVILILEDPSIMDGKRFELRINFDFQGSKMSDAKLFKQVGEPGSTIPADLDPIDFKIAIGCLNQEDKHILGRPGFRTYEDLADSERKFLIEIAQAERFIREQGKEFMAGRRSRAAKPVNRPEKPRRAEQVRVDPLSDIDAVLAEADSLRASVTNPDSPRHL